MSTCKINQNYQIGERDTHTGEYTFHRNIRLNRVKKEIEVIKYTTPGNLATFTIECSLPITDTAVGLQTLGNNLKFIPESDVNERRVKMIIKEAGNPKIEIEEKTGVLNLIGEEDIRIGRMRSEIDLESKFKIEFDSSSKEYILDF